MALSKSTSRRGSQTKISRKHARGWGNEVKNMMKPRMGGDKGWGGKLRTVSHPSKKIKTQTKKKCPSNPGANHELGESVYGGNYGRYLSVAEYLKNKKAKERSLPQSLRETSRGKVSNGPSPFPSDKAGKVLFLDWGGP